MLTVIDLDDIEMSSAAKVNEWELEFQLAFNQPLVQAAKTQEFLQMDSAWRDAMPSDQKDSLKKRADWVAQQVQGNVVTQE